MRSREFAKLPQRVWFHLVNALFLAALLSALQIFLRQSLANQQPELPRLIVLNLIAWAPWLPLAATTLILLRHFPLTRSRLSKSALVHGAAALTATSVFLIYLSLFRLLTQGRSVELSALWTTLGYEVGDFLLVCLLLYGAIVAFGSLWLGPTKVPPAADASGSEPAVPIEVPRLQVKSRGRTRFLAASSVDWISAEGSYVRLHVGGQSHLLRATMKEMEELLRDHGFARIHRSSIVNRSRVVARRARPKGDGEVELDDGTILRQSRRYRNGL